MFESLGQAEELLAMLLTLADNPAQINRLRQTEHDFKLGKLRALEAEGKLEFLDDEEWYARYHLEEPGVKLTPHVTVRAVDVRKPLLGDWKTLRKATPEDQIIALVRGVASDGTVVVSNKFALGIPGADIDDLQEVVLFPFARRPGGTPNYGAMSAASSDGQPSSDPSTEST